MIEKSLLMNKAELEIYTFDNFEVKFRGESITSAFASSPTIFNLFKFFIANKGKYLSVDYIEENLWDYKEYYDLKNAIKGQVFRLRKTINKASDAHCMGQLINYIDIRSIDRCYVLQLKGDYFLDSESFSNKAEELLQDKKTMENNLDEYLSALSLYKDNFMNNSSHEGWITSSRNQYKRLYLKLVRKTVEALKTMKNDKLALDILEKALKIEFFDEGLNMDYLKMLISQGSYSEALCHFKYVRDKFSKEFEIDPSPAFSNLQQLIYSAIYNYNNTDSISRALEIQQREMSSKKLVDIETYNKLEKLERKISERQEIPSVMMEIDLTLEEGVEAKQLEELMPIIVEETIRKSDVYTLDGLKAGSVKLLLYDINEDNYHIVKERLLNNIESRAGNDYREMVNISFIKL